MEKRTFLWHFGGVLRIEKKSSCSSEAPTTPPMALAIFANVASPEKRTRTKADLPEYTGLSPAKCRMVEAENVDSKFTPLDKVRSKVLSCVKFCVFL